MPKNAATAAKNINQLDYSAADMGPGELALILAAEQAFAEHGIAGVSLRQVNQAAGHKNMAAAHYHFGSRDGLVLAVLKHRLPKINERRSELLSRASAADRDHDLRFYLEAYVIPLAEQLTPRPEGNFYLRFLLQFRSARLDRDVLKSLAPAAFAMSDKIGALLSYLPAEVVTARHINVLSMIIGTLATTEGELSTGARDVRGVDLIASNLIDAATAMMTAPISPETLRIVRGKKPR